jgi:hypothetical protein
MAIVHAHLKYTSLDVPASSKWLIESKAINGSLLMPRMIVSGLDKSVVQLVNCTNKPVHVRPALALGNGFGHLLEYRW